MQIRDVSLVVPGATETSRIIKATSFTPDAPNGAAMLFLSGALSFRHNYMPYAVEVTNETNATSMTLDLGGRGESEGSTTSLSVTDHLEDVKTAYDFLSAEPGVQAERVGVAGASYGGYLAVLLCRERRPKSLMLRAPAIHEELPDDFNAMTASGQLRENLKQALPEQSTLTVLGDFDGSVTVVESEFDSEVRPRSIEACVVAGHATHHIIRGANHALKGNERLVFQSMLVNWAAEL